MNKRREQAGLTQDALIQDVFGQSPLVSAAVGGTVDIANMVGRGVGKGIKGLGKGLLNLGRGKKGSGKGIFKKFLGGSKGTGGEESSSKLEDIVENTEKLNEMSARQKKEGKENQRSRLKNIENQREERKISKDVQSKLNQIVKLLKEMAGDETGKKSGGLFDFGFKNPFSFKNLFKGIKAIGTGIAAGFVFLGKQIPKLFKVALKGLKIGGRGLLAIGSKAMTSIAGFLIDGVLGFFSAEEWGSSKLASVIGGALGGTISDGGWLNASTNAMKWGMAGIAAGTPFGPPGMIVGGVIGAMIGGILGWIGGKNIAEYSDKVGGMIMDGVQRLSDWWTGLIDSLILSLEDSALGSMFVKAFGLKTSKQKAQEELENQEATTREEAADKQRKEMGLKTVIDENGRVARRQRTQEEKRRDEEVGELIGSENFVNFASQASNRDRAVELMELASEGNPEAINQIREISTNKNTNIKNIKNNNQTTTNKNLSSSSKTNNGSTALLMNNPNIENVILAADSNDQRQIVAEGLQNAGLDKAINQNVV